jgi:hypothetical protein
MEPSVSTTRCSVHRPALILKIIALKINESDAGYAKCQT